MIFKSLMKGLIVFQVFLTKVLKQKRKMEKPQTINRPKAELLSNLCGTRGVLEHITATRATLATLFTGVFFENNKSPILCLIQTVQLPPRPF